MYSCACSVSSELVRKIVRLKVPVFMRLFGEFGLFGEFAKKEGWFMEFFTDVSLKILQQGMDTILEAVKLNRTSNLKPLIMLLNKTIKSVKIRQVTDYQKAIDFLNEYLGKFTVQFELEPLISEKKQYLAEALDILWKLQKKVENYEKKQRKTTTSKANVR